MRNWWLSRDLMFGHLPKGVASECKYSTKLAVRVLTIASVMELAKSPERKHVFIGFGSLHLSSDMLGSSAALSRSQVSCKSGAENHALR